MIKRSLHGTLIVAPIVFWLGGCATPPSPPGGPPVVDRSVRPTTPEPPAPPLVEVKPLERPDPIVAETGPLVPEDPYSNLAQTPEPTQPAPVVATAPVPEQRPPAAEISREGNDAVVALLDSAADYVGTGELDKAGASLERALRIEPRNASIWHDLGQIRLHQSKYQEAESLATKSNSLSGDNTMLQARNWRLIAVARRAVGDEVGADAAEAQALLAER